MRSASRWLAGVAKNLLAHPGADDDGVRWLAFEVSQRTHGAALKRRSSSQAVTAALPRATADRPRRRFRAASSISRTFAAAAAAWAPCGGRRTPERHCVAPTETGRTAAADSRRASRQLATARRSRRHLGAAARREARARDQDGEGTTPGNAGTHRPRRERRLSRLHHRHDRVVNAASLASRDELATLRSRLEAEFGAMRSIVARLAKRLMRVLMARQVREWRFDLDEGVLDGSRLARARRQRRRARARSSRRATRRFRARSSPC